MSHQNRVLYISTCVAEFVRIDSKVKFITLKNKIFIQSIEIYTFFKMYIYYLRVIVQTTVIILILHVYVLKVSNNGYLIYDSQFI